MKFRLHPLFDEDGAIGAESGVETAPAAEEQSTEGSASQSGVESQAAAEPEKPNNYEKAFAKRLSAEREKWEKETSERYKDYDVAKEIASYFSEVNNADLITLKERIELERLQARAEQANVPPDVMKRIDELEAKAAKAEEYEQQQQQAKVLQDFENGLKEFAKDKQIDGKPVDHMELWQYMHDNGIAKPEAALKAMKADILEQKLETARQDAVKEYLSSKQAPKVEGSTGAAGTTSVDTSKMSWKELQQHALSRIEAAKTPQ